MSDPASLTHARPIVSTILALAIAIAGLHLAVVRPYLWPAGAGIVLSGDRLFASLGGLQPIPQLQPPDVVKVANSTVIVTRANPSRRSATTAVIEGTVITSIYNARVGRIELSQGIPSDPERVLTIWRDAYNLGTQSPLELRVRPAADEGGIIKVEREPVWRTDDATQAAWLRQHGGPLLQVIAFLGGALALVALGTSGTTARLMTLALICAAVATAGPLYGEERTAPVIGGVLLLLSWIATPLAFPIIGLAVLYFPSRAAILDRHPWISLGLGLAAAPMLAIGLLTAAFLLGANSVLPFVTWIATNGWLFNLSFAVALAANVAIVLEGAVRYRGNRDANERRRIQMVVYTGVPAVLAYALSTSIPALSSLTGVSLQLPWLLEALLRAIVLLPALALPYAVAVKHVFSPRTVLRRSLQYALARRTLSVLMALPLAALVGALVTNRARPLSDIVLGQPMFYAVVIVLAGLTFRYRDAAQRWLDQRFFRAEYDAREILVSLANRLPRETEPRQLVTLVVSEIDSALHPESIAVLAGDDDRLEVVSSVRTDVGVLARNGALATLLRWSEDPLEVFLDDERSPATRLPAVDRAWLDSNRLSLLVPIFAGSGDKRALTGLIGLGRKRSEEPYTLEDRRLLNGIAGQMSVAMDLSRLRRRLSSGSRPAAGTVLASAAIPADVPTTLGKIPAIVDGKYRIDTLVGRGGMGAVYRAHDLRLGRDVAIKVVRADLLADPAARSRFSREAQIVARLQHPAIVTVFDYGTLPDGAAFLVMEYVRGEDLRSLLKREQQLAPPNAIPLVAGIAAGIEFAHRAGVLHRDLKPENVLLPDSGIGPKVLDFGVATIADSETANFQTLTHGGTIVGTPAYMAPEQLRGERVDERADVYSLAVVTFEILTGRLPFGAGSIVEIGIKQTDLTGQVDVSGVPATLLPVLMKALSLARDERPASAAAFASALSAPSAQS